MQANCASFFGKAIHELIVVRRYLDAPAAELTALVLTVNQRTKRGERRRYERRVDVLCVLCVCALCSERR